MNINPVQNKAQLDLFLNLPYTLYKNDPVWIPPLRDEQKSQFDPKRNPLLEHTDYQLFLLEDGGIPVGRIAAHIDRLAVDFWKEPVGLFGYFEAHNHPGAAKLLLDAAGNWLKERKMQAIRGPWSFVSQEWGCVLEGYEPSPVIMCPYNPPFYNELFTGYGMDKVKDLLVYYIDAREGYQIPKRVLTLTDKVAQKYQIRIRQVNMQDFDREIDQLIEVSNASLWNNWGYSPVTEVEVRAMAHDLRPVVHPKGIIFAEDPQGKTIGFAIALPDVNMIFKGLNGSLFPFGWAKLLWLLPRLKQYRMFALGVIPEYHGKGIDSLIYRALYESLFSEQFRMEINYVLEDNGPMNNAILKLNAKPLRRYRIYQKTI